MAQPDFDSDNFEQEQQEWLDALNDVKREYGETHVKELLRKLQDGALNMGVTLNEATLNTPYVNTIPVDQQPAYPGDIAIERRVENIIRWNAMAMVLRAQDSGSGVGGHIATYGSAATVMEVGFNHFFRGEDESYGGDLVIPQPHAAPGIYARAYLEGRFDERQLGNFRRENQPGGGLSSYPHPRLMPDFWQVPCASMGLSTPTAIYQARFAKYLENRGLKRKAGGKVWCFIGDGEADEPEVLGTINIAAREKLDNLVLVVNCNLQRLDGPVRGNGKIIQELERSFRGADWNVIKVIWGSGWDGLLSRDHDGTLRRRMEAAVDGDYQYYSVSPGNRQRELWVDNDPALEKMMNSLTDEEIHDIKRGGQDVKKIFAAYSQAITATGKPTVILVKTVKGDGMTTVQGSNTVHQKKNLSAEERISCGKAFGIPLADSELAKAAFYRPPESSDEIRYLKEHRHALGGFLPRREVDCPALQPPSLDAFKDLLSDSGERQFSTTTAAVRMLAKLLKDKTLGKYVVPIVPDEARTFGMDALFRVAGIYSPDGQNYTPVDAESLLSYTEAKDGQLLQEGICETGAMASFLAAGTAYAVHGVPTIPFYLFYSIFGFQRVGDMIWACGDMMARGFLLGGTAGRTTLNGEGLQHQDGHSQVVASTVPNLKSYDPAFSYELAVIVRDGIERMYTNGEKIFYYLTVYNENHHMPALPASEHARWTVEEQITLGMYRLRKSASRSTRKVHLLASGSIMQQAIAAQEVLESYDCSVDIWSVTSFNELYREAIACERWNRLNPTAEPKLSYLEQLMENESGIFVGVSDYMKSFGLKIGKWLPGEFVTLGTDGFGLSEDRDSLRAYFEVDATQISLAALDALRKIGENTVEDMQHLIAEQGIDGNKRDPAAA
ncbi:MAG: pyruvate dehydrogenase (acetyl-transferring), homodimeric type [Gammaproteobacteria bacterium]